MLTVRVPSSLLQINYAESQVECRRVLIMQHFGEHGFTHAQCRGTCDVCAARGDAAVQEEDVSEEAAAMVRLVRDLGARGFSPVYVMELFRGAPTSRNKQQVGNVWHLCRANWMMADAAACETVIQSHVMRNSRTADGYRWRLMSPNRLQPLYCWSAYTHTACIYYTRPHCLSCLPQVQRFQHDQLPDFGAGAEMQRDTVERMVRRLQFHTYSIHWATICLWVVAACCCRNSQMVREIPCHS